MARFFRRGISVVRFTPTVASLAAPTTAEFSTNAKDLTPFLAEMSGFQLSNAPIPVPNLKDIFTPQIQGEDTVEDSTLTLNDDNSTALDTIRTACAKGTAGFIILAPYGAGSGKRCEVWPVTVTGVNDTWSVGNDPATVVFGFAITAVPNQAAVTP